MRSATERLASACPVFSTVEPTRTMDVGTIGRERAEWSHYVYGADLVALYEAGVEISWPVARCLYAAIGCWPIACNAQVTPRSPSPRCSW